MTEYLPHIAIAGTALNAIVAFLAIRKHCNDDKAREISDRVRSELNSGRITELECRLRG